MQEILYATCMGFVAGVLGTALGGIIAAGTKMKEKRAVSFVMEFSAGLMLALVCLDLLPEAFYLSNVTMVGSGILLGSVTVVFLQNVIKFALPDIINNPSAKTGLLLALGVSIHNFPEGLAIGSSLDLSPQVGLSIAAVIALHNMPEGLALSLPLRAGGYQKLKIVLISVLAGLPMAFGSFVGAAVGSLSDSLISLCLGFASGAMLYIVCEDIIPKSKKIHCGRFSTLGNMIGIITGIIVSLLST